VTINQTGTPDHFEYPRNHTTGSLDGRLLRIGIVCARFNEFITKSLLMGAISGLSDHHVSDANHHTYWVPGAFEIPLMMSHIMPTYDAVIALACVIKGDTAHFDYVCDAVTQGVLQVSLQHQKPGIFGVLTTDTVDQALERARPHSPSNKGYEAALTAIEMANALTTL
jgi:6,7-dimethyl-8-ribityllumazine synthase